MSEVPEGLLPVHGFVLAGGKSSRMGRDKATLPFRGTPMVEIALRKLQSFCAKVSVVGERKDLAPLAEVVSGEQAERGPAAGIAVGMRACQQPWALFIPVDVPLVPAGFLRFWAEEALRVSMSVSYLGAGRAQPAFCLLQRERAESLSALAEAGEGRLERLLKRTAEIDGCGLQMYSPEDFSNRIESGGLGEGRVEGWFHNVNTP